MQIAVHVIPRARQNSIMVEPNGSFRMHTTAAPTDGAANAAVIKMMAKYLGVPKSQIKIIRGETSHDKILEY